VRIDLEIGGYAIRLDEPEDHACLHWPFVTFDPFVAAAAHPPDIAMTVRVVRRLPEIPHGPVLYDACHGLWKWHAADGGYLLESPHRTTRGPEALALVSEDITSAVVWTLAQATRGKKRTAWAPMQVINPIVEACLVTRLARDGGLLLHAAGVLTAQGGLAFTGVSGAGKSTISDLYTAQGARVLSDERIILRRANGGIQVFGTPWPGAGRHAQNHQGPLGGLFHIRHAEDGHRLHRMPAHAAAPAILPQCFLPHWDRRAMDETLAFLGMLLENVDCFELAFMKTPDVAEFIEDQLLGSAVASS
jgi:hypothetical protein